MYQIKKSLLLILLFCTVACSTSIKQDDIALRKKYLTIAKNKDRSLDQHYYQLFLGELNKDGIKDGVIEYGYGEGMRPIGKKILILFSSNHSIEPIISYEPNYCLKVDTIFNAKLMLSELSDCITGKGEIISKRALRIVNGKIQEEVIWSIRNQLIQSIKDLAQDLENKELSELKEQYHFDFTKYGSSMEQEIPLIKAILMSNDLNLLNIKTILSSTLKRDAEEIRYEINRVSNTAITLTAWFKGIEQSVTGESLFRYYFKLKNEKLVFSNFSIAG